MDSDNGGPAFPCVYGESPGQLYVDDGMSLRDYFAGQALQGLLAAQIHGFNDALKNGPWADMAYEMADAMLKHRDALIAAGGD